MKLSKPLQHLVNRADYLEVVPTLVRTATTWDERYTIRVYSQFGDFATTPQSWKTAGGAYRAACKLRPDLFPFGIEWGV